MRVRYLLGMQYALRARLVVCSALLVAASACTSNSPEDANMGSKPAGKPRGGLESDPYYYKLNSVMGTVTSGGKPVAGATVMIAATGESFPVGPSGEYVIVLDPVKLGGKGSELVFRAPGYVEQRQYALVPENNQIRIDVELVREKG
jgi:hypothetical protein